MRIGIDVRYASHGLVGGVHTYVSQFVPELVDQADGHEVYLYADTKCRLEWDGMPGNPTTRYLPWRSPLSSVYNDLVLWRWMAADRLDLAHFPANYGFGPPTARTVVTVHDAINLMPLREIVRGHRKDARTIATMTYLHWSTTRAVRRAHLLLTVSAHAQREIARFSSFDVNRIVPVPHGPTPDLRRIEDSIVLAEVCRRHGLSKAFILADALKNPATVVRAWRLLPENVRQGREIVFFSRRPDLLPIVREAVAAGEARLLVHPSRDDLIALYSMAEAFVFPSWIEGFGIPLIEAMACGAPIIASDRGAIPEVVGDIARLAEADNAAAVAHHLEAILGCPEETQRMRAQGFARAAEFSWRKTARSILSCYENAMSLRN